MKEISPEELYSLYKDTLYKCQIETLERLVSRIRNMYRPDLKKYCLRLSSIETHVVMTVLVGVMRSGDDPYMVALGNRIEDSLFNQVNTEINIYNAMR